jgi:hypothetical protein
MSVDLLPRKTLDLLPLPMLSLLSLPLPIVSIPPINDYVPGRVTFRDNEWMVITLTIEVGMEMIGMDVMVMETIIVDVVIMVATITVDEKTAVVEDVDNILKPLMAPEHADNILKLPTRTKAGTYNIL